jgi:hypothetical protein
LALHRASQQAQVGIAAASSAGPQANDAGAANVGAAAKTKNSFHAKFLIDFYAGTE